jgi:hypothetical protein
LKVAVVGGDVGGLTLALSLDLAGIHDVDTYRSSPSIRCAPSVDGTLREEPKLLKNPSTS